MSILLSPRHSVARRESRISPSLFVHALRVLWLLCLLLCGSQSLHADIWSTFAGAPNPSGNVDGPAATAKIWRPLGITRDPSGNLFFCENDHANVIRKITTAGVVSTFAGNYGSRNPFYGVTDAAADSAGNIYFLCRFANQVLKVSPSGTFNILAGSVAGYKDGTGTSAAFSSLLGIAVDPSGNIYVSDQGGTVIRKITQTGVVSTFAGAAGVAARTDGTGATARFDQSDGLACDLNGNIYAADNITLRKITPGGVVTTLAGNPNSRGNDDGTGTNARFNNLNKLWIDNTGNIFAVDFDNHRIRKITPDGVVTSIAGSATGRFGYANGTGTAALFAYPVGITGDNAGNLYVTEPANHAIRKIEISTGAVTTWVGSGAVGGNNGNGIAARFCSPMGMAFDSSRNLYVADLGNSAIRKIAPNGNVTIAAGSMGFSGNVDGNLSTARLGRPTSIAVDKTNTVYFTDSGYNLKKLTPDGTVTFFAGSYPGGFVNGTGTTAKFNYVSGIATDSAGNVFVADLVNNAIRKVTPNGVVTTFAGGTEGVLDGTGAQAQFNRPRDVVLDQNDNLYVIEINGSIRKITPSSVVTTILSQKLYLPEKIQLDGKGGFYVTEAGHNIIRRVSMSGVVTTLGGIDSHPGSADAPVQFSSPQGLAVDPEGRVFVSDAENHNIRMGIITDGPPSLMSQPSALNVVAGASASFNVNAVGTDPLTYQWRKDGANIAGATSATYTIAATKTIDGGAYTVVVTNALGTVTSATATLTVLPAGSVPPVITQQPKSLQFPLGSKATFSVTATGTPAPTYQWRKDGTALTGGTAATYTIDVIKAADAGVYDVVVSNALGSVTSTVATLTIPAVGVNVPPNIVVQPANLDVIPGKGATFSVGATGSAPLTYQWRKGGVAITGATAARYTISSTALSDAGTFDVVITNPYGKATSTAVTLTVNTPPESAPVITTQPADVASYAGASATFAVAATGVPAPTYQWLKSGVPISGATGATYRIANVQATDAGAYSVVVSNTQGNTTSNAATLSIKTIVSQSGNWYKVTGNPGGPGDADGQGKNARFYSPTSVALDSLGNLYVTDRLNYVIRKITPSGMVSKVPNSGTNCPQWITADSADNLFYVSSFASDISKITSTGAVSKVAPGKAQLGYAMAVALDPSGNLYASHWQGTATIRKLTPAGVASDFAGAGNSTESTDGVGTNAHFYYSRGMTSDAAGNLYVADSGGKIRKISPGGLVTTLQNVNLQGTGFGLIIDSNNNFYVTVNNRISKVASDMSVSAVAGRTNGDYGYADGTGSNASFKGPQGIARDAAGNLFVADTGNHLIRKITPSGVVTTLAGYTETDLKDGSLANARIRDLSDNPSLLIDAGKNLYFCDTNAVRKVSPDGFVTTIAGSITSGKTDGPGGTASFNGPGGLAKDNAGNLYVADTGNHTIRKITPTGVVSTFAGTSGSSGLQDGPAATAKFNSPRAIVIDGSGNLYVSDYYNHVIRKITQMGVVSTFSGSGTLGKEDGAAGVAQFGNLTSMALAPDNSIYLVHWSDISGVSSLLLRKVSPDGSASTVASLSGSMKSVSGIAFDGQGLLHILADNRVFRRDLDGVVRQIAGGGSVSDDSGPSSTIKLFGPKGIAIDPNGILYVTEIDSNKIRACTLADVPVKITAQPASTSANRGAPVVFSIATTGTGPVSYQWRFNGVEIPGAIGSTLTIPAAQTSDAGSYDVVAANGANFVVSSSATLTVNNTVTAPLVITTQPADVTTYKNTYLTLSVAATGPGPLTYQWRKNGLNIVGATQPTYSVTPAQESDSGIYEVDVTNPFTTVTSKTVTVNVSPLTSSALTITTHPINVNAPLGKTANFSVMATRSTELTSPITYQWRKDGIEIAGATASSYQIAAVTASDAGSYDVVIGCGGFNLISSAAFLKTGSPVTLLSGPQDTNSTAGSSVTLSVNVAGTLPITYQWLKGGVAIKGANAATLTLANVTAADAGVYSVTAANAFGALATAPSATLRLNLPPSIVKQPQSLLLKMGAKGTMSVDAAGTGPIYCQWRKNSVPIWGATDSTYTITNANSDSAGMYDCVVSNLLQSVTSAPAFVQVNSPISLTRQPVGGTLSEGSTFSLSVQAKGADLFYYQWYKLGPDGRPRTAGNQATLNFKSITANDAGTYYVTVMGNGMLLTSESAVVRVGTGPNVMILAQPQNFSTTGGKLVTVPMTVDPNDIGILETRYRLYSVQNGVATPTTTEGVVRSDGKVSVPVRTGMVQAEQAWIVRFTRKYQTGAVASVDTQRFYASVLSWDVAAGTYEALLQDTSASGTYGDGAVCRGMLTVTVTNTGAVSGQLRFTEAPVLPDAPTLSRAYLPVVRAFADTFAPSNVSPNQWTCAPTLGVGAQAGREELALTLDFSKTPVVLSAVVKDNASLPYPIVGESRASSTRCVSALPADLTQVTGSYILTPDPAASPAGTDSNAYALVQLLPSGRVTWTSKLAGYSGSGTALLNTDNPVHLSATLYEGALTSGNGRLLGRTLMGNLALDYTWEQKWQIGLNGAPLNNQLEYQFSEVAGTSSAGVLKPVYQPANVSGVRHVDFSAQTGFRWNNDVFNALAPDQTLLHLSTTDPVLGNAGTFSWDVIVSSNGSLIVLPTAPLGITPPPLTLRLNKTLGEWSGSYTSGSLLRNLNGVFVPGNSIRAAGWVEGGTLNSRWLMRP